MYPKGPRGRRRSVRIAGFAVLFAAAATAGSMAALHLFDLGGQPDVGQLADHRASLITRVRALDDEVVAEFAEERRVVVQFDDMPSHLVQAIVDVEDQGFFDHAGLNLRGIARAMVRNVRQGRVVEGGSSLTQQLAKLMFLTPERSLGRKAREAVLALNIERAYSKEEILALYSNQVYLGHNRYGVEAAARFYFGKGVSELTLAEAALIAGLPQRPEGSSPHNDPEAARVRRDHVLDRMVAAGHIAAAEAERAKRQPLGVVPRARTASATAPYFVEEVRRWLERSYGARRLYHDGLEVRTTLDPALQVAAEEAIRAGLSAHHRRRTGEDPGPDGPIAEAALVAIEVETGRVVALVGGWDFARSRFNRATQALRQTGSAFKPVLYAAAIASGFTPSDNLFDEPIEIEDPDTGVVYSPQNHGRSYHGLTTVRTALEKSRNPLAVQLLQRVGASAVIGLARKLGVSSTLEPYPSLALGAFEASLIEMTAAYAALADLGLYHPPYLVESVHDRDGKLLHRRDPIAQRAVAPEVAYVTTHMLQGVIENGTGRRARVLDGPLAGKTGTTDDQTDAWFVGYSARLAVGVWVGLDEKRTLGAGEEGARAALPIWIDFMQEALAERPAEAFRVPPNVQFVRVDKATGLRASGVCQDTIQEAFVRGSAPSRYCSHWDHELRAYPYTLQRHLVDLGPAEVAEVLPAATLQ